MNVTVIDLKDILRIVYLQCGQKNTDIIGLRAECNVARSAYDDIARLKCTVRRSRNQLEPFRNRLVHEINVECTT